MQPQRGLGAGDPGRLRALAAQGGGQVQARPAGLLDRRRDPQGRVGLRPLAAARGALGDQLGRRRRPRPVPLLDLGDLRRRCQRRRAPRHLQRPRLGLRHRQLPARLRRAGRLAGARFSLTTTPSGTSKRCCRPPPASAPGCTMYCAGAAAQPRRSARRASGQGRIRRQVDRSSAHPLLLGWRPRAQARPIAGSYCWSADGRQVFGADERGLDCSGAVRWLLVLSGYTDPGASGLRRARRSTTPRAAAST